MLIRPVVSQDRESILRILRQRDTFNEEEIRVAMEVLDEVLKCPDRQDYQILCASEGTDGLYGYLCFGPIPMTDGCYDLYWIAVDEGCARKGVAAALLGRMEEFMARKKARRIYIDTSSTFPYTPARAFYEKHGFKLVSTLEDFYRLGDHKLIFMKEVQAIET